MEASMKTINGFGDDESFSSILCDSLDMKKTDTNELQAAIFWLDKLSQIRNKYEGLCLSMADSMDEIVAKKTLEFTEAKAICEEKVKQLEDATTKLTETLDSATNEHQIVAGDYERLKAGLLQVAKQITSLIDRNFKNIDEPVEIVTIAESDAEDNGNEVAEETLQVGLNEPAAPASTETIEQDKGTEPMEEEKLPNGDGKQETVEKNDVEQNEFEKENVRPQSTPIQAANPEKPADGKTDEPVAALKPILKKTRIPTPMVAIKNEQPDGVNNDATETAETKAKEVDAAEKPIIVVAKKKRTSGPLKVRKQNVTVPGKFVMAKRKHILVESNDDDDDDDDESADDDDEYDYDDEASLPEQLAREGYVLVRKKKHARKQGKKGKRAKLVYSY